jgi:hypothetical protein
MSQLKTMIFLLLAALSLASPTNPYTTQDTLSILPQDPTITLPTLPSIPTITLGILQPPFVSLHSLSARDSQTIRLTTSGTTDLTSTTTTTTTAIPTLTIVTVVSQTASFSTVLQVGSEVPVATFGSALRSESEVSVTSSSSDLRSATEVSVSTLISVKHNGSTASSVQQTGTKVSVATSTDSGHAPTATVKRVEWDCTALCGELDKDGECTSIAGCVAVGDGSEKVKGMKPPHAGSASLSDSSKKLAVTVFALVVLVGTLF